MKTHGFHHSPAPRVSDSVLDRAQEFAFEFLADVYAPGWDTTLGKSVSLHVTSGTCSFNTQGQV